MDDSLLKGILPCIREGRMNSIVVEICYRMSPQSERVVFSACSVLDNLSKHHDLVVMGDFNFPDVCWETNSAKHPESFYLLIGLPDNFLFQMVEEASKNLAILNINQEARVGGWDGGGDILEK